MQLLSLVCATLIVQTQLLEGHASKSWGFHKFTGIRVVFTSDTFSDDPALTIMPTAPLNIVYDDGNKQLTEQKLLPYKNYTLFANAMDRASFFVKIDKLVPIDLYYFHNGSNLVHLDMDIYSKLKQLSPNDLLDANLTTSHTLAQHISEFFKALFSGSMITRHSNYSDTVHFNTTNTQIAHIKKRHTDTHTRLVTYHHLHDMHYGHLVKREGPLWSQLGTFLKNTTASIHRHLSNVLEFASNVLGQLGVKIIDILKYIKDSFHWDQVNRSRKVMLHLSTVIKDGIFESIDYVDMKLFEHFARNEEFDQQDISTKQMQLFDSIMAGKKLSAVTDKKTSMVRKYKIVNEDARSSYIEDLYVQNMPHAEAGNMTEKMAGVNQLGIQFFDAIKEQVFQNQSMVEQVPLEILEIWNKGGLHGTSPMGQIRLLWMSLSKIMNRVGHGLSKMVFKAFMRIFKQFMHLYWQITNFELYIPILSDMLHYAMGVPRRLSFLGTWTCMGAALFTFTFKAYKHRPPISEYDMNLLLSVKSPYLLVWKWENDPVTGPPSKDGAYKKGCILDWMTKAMTFCARGFAYTTGRILKRQSSIFVAIMKSKIMRSVDDEASLRSFYDATFTDKAWAVCNYVFSFNNFLSANLRFPYDYLDRNDPHAIREQMRKPDKDRWLYWMIRYPRTLFYTMRPFLEGKYRRTHPFALELFKFSTNGALKWTILPQNIVNLYKGTDVQDQRRFLVWGLTSIYWTMSMFGDLADLFTGFFDAKAYGNKADGLYGRLFDRVNRPKGIVYAFKQLNDLTDILSNFFCFLRYQVYVGYGMTGWYGTIRNVTF